MLRPLYYFSLCCMLSPCFQAMEVKEEEKEPSSVVEMHSFPKPSALTTLSSDSCIDMVWQPVDKEIDTHLTVSNVGTSQDPLKELSLATFIGHFSQKMKRYITAYKKNSPFGEQYAFFFPKGFQSELHILFPLLVEFLAFPSTYQAYQAQNKLSGYLPEISFTQEEAITPNILEEFPQVLALHPDTSPNFFEKNSLKNILHLFFSTYHHRILTAPNKVSKEPNLFALNLLLTIFTLSQGDLFISPSLAHLVQGKYLESPLTFIYTGGLFFCCVGGYAVGEMKSRKNSQITPQQLYPFVYGCLANFFIIFFKTFFMMSGTTLRAFPLFLGQMILVLKAYSETSKPQRSFKDIIWGKKRKPFSTLFLLHQTDQQLALLQAYLAEAEKKITLLNEQCPKEISIEILTLADPVYALYREKERTLAPRIKTFFQEEEIPLWVRGKKPSYYQKALFIGLSCLFALSHIVSFIQAFLCYMHNEKHN